MAATAQQMLDAVNDAILARLTGGAVSSYTIGSRSLSSFSLDEMYKLRSNLQAEVAAASTGGIAKNYGEIKVPR